MLFMEVGMENSFGKMCFDKKLNIEILTLSGRVKKLPNHFHDFYEIGYIEEGSTNVVCQGEECVITKGDVVIFNPNDNHSCSEIDNKYLDFRCLNISIARMKELTLECLGYEVCPYFQPQIMHCSELAPQIKELHGLISDCSCRDLQKEELLYLIIGDLVSDFSREDVYEQLERNLIIEKVCSYIESHYNENISLDDLSAYTGFSKYHFLRIFTKEKGITPYRFIECIKITKAKEMLIQGIDIADISFQLGFSSQSHFTNFFKKYTRVTPKQYGRLYNN